MKLSTLPTAASWTHLGTRTGFEVLFGASVTGNSATAVHALRGQTTARDESSSWNVGYEIETDSSWRTRRVFATNSTASGTAVTVLQCTDNSWTVDDVRRPDLDGCIDVDFESSVVTNTLPLHRIDFVPGVAVEVPAVFVRAVDLRVERLEQRYTLIASTDDGFMFLYEAPAFGFSSELHFDATGLILDYPGIAVRDR